MRIPLKAKVREAMIKLEEVAAETYAIKVIIPKVDTEFTIYFIRDGKGALIEPGPSLTIPSIQEAMKQLGMNDLAYIIPTHIHLDHAGAIGSLAQLFLDAKVLLHNRGAKHAKDPSRLIESTRMSFGNDFEDLFGPIIPVPENQVRTSSDGETISMNGRSLQIIHTPGHAPHHLAIFDQKTKGLFSGEALGVPIPGAKFSPVPAAAPPSFDIEEYLKSIEKLRQLHPRLLFYSHDGVGQNPEELISMVMENTKILGDMILKGLKEGMDNEAIQALLRKELGNADEKTLPGFIHYFKKQGLV